MRGIAANLYPGTIALEVFRERVLAAPVVIVPTIAVVALAAALIIVPAAAASILLSLPHLAPISK
jgi:hypothetical protein